MISIWAARTTTPPTGRPSASCSRPRRKHATPRGLTGRSCSGRCGSWPARRAYGRSSTSAPASPPQGTCTRSPGRSRRASAWPTSITTVASRVVHTHAGPVRLPEANTGAEALRASLSAPQSTGAARGTRETRSQSVLGVSWHRWPVTCRHARGRDDGTITHRPVDKPVDNLSLSLSLDLSLCAFTCRHARGRDRDNWERQLLIVRGSAGRADMRGPLR